MKYLLSALFALIATAYAFADAPKPTLPEDGATVDIRPAVQRVYKSPEERNWDGDYRPGKLKEKNDQDCSQPTPVEFKWEPATAKGANYTLQISTSPEFPANDLIEIATGDQTTATATNFNIGTAYYWRVRAEAQTGDNSYAVCHSPTWSFKTSDYLPRWYDLPNLSNVRDAGGWKTADGKKKVKMGMVYRGGEFDQHSDLTPESKKYLLETMGIRVDLDLRGPSEWNNVEDYSSPLGGEVAWKNFRIGGYDGIFDDRNKELFRDMFKLLAKRESYPIYIHCMAGADRTGTTLVALKSVLGCSDGDLAMDYEFTSFSKYGDRHIGEGSAYGKMCEKLKEYEGETVAQRFVSYLKSTGVTEEELQSIRDLLLEEVE